MKKNKIKLSLNKETLNVLNEFELNAVQGGTTIPCAVAASSNACAATVGFVGGIAGNYIYDFGKDGSYWGCDFGKDKIPMRSVQLGYGGGNGGQLDNTYVSRPLVIDCLAY